MTMSDLREPTFDGLSAPAGGEIVAVANAAAAHADHDDSVGELVIVARTASGDHRTVGGGRVGPLRAAISVAVAAGNYRLWRGAVGHDTIERPVRALPEIVRAAAEAAGVQVVHIGCIEDESLAAIAAWFEVDGKVAGANARRDTMLLLSTAAERQREFFAAKVAATAARPEPQPAAAPSGARSFDPDDPRLDAVTGLATRVHFEDAMNNYQSDEATLVVVDLDDFESVSAQYGESVTDAVLREIADRLVSSCRREDLIARLDVHTFAILFTDASRSVGLHVAKRVLATIALPLPIAGGPEVVTATVALSHQFGLVDMDELFEAADSAVASGKRSGHGRLVIAS
jgi:diguanylate cyclase (GGDEF)-like protein